MHRDLLLKSFDKARKELMKEGYVAPSDSLCAKRLSDIVSETFPYSEKSFRNYYKKALKAREDEVCISRPEVLNAMAVYLGKTDYKDFLKASDYKRVSKIDAEVNDPLDKKNDSKTKSETNKIKFLYITVVVSLVLFLALFGYNYFTKQRWMEWQDTHYVETVFDAEKLKAGILKVYKEDRIENFKQIFPTSNTVFFNTEGEVMVWYSKNKDGTLDCFTSYGIHPKTGKHLKPITEYMIAKYILK